MEKPRYKCWTKAVIGESGKPGTSLKWVLSRRAWFKVFERRIECGDWIIRFSEIQNAIVYRTRQNFIPVTVLSIATAEESYQFGFNPWANPIMYLHLPYREETVKLKNHNPYLWYIKLIAIGSALGWISWGWLK